MKPKMGVIAGLFLFLAMGSTAWADGGNIPDQACPGVSGSDQFFTGTFTATYKDFKQGAKPTHYLIRYKLKKGSKLQEKADSKDPKKKVYSDLWEFVQDEFTREIPTNPKGLCIDDSVELIQVYDPYVKRTGKAKAADKLGFGSEWEACLTDVRVTEKTNCALNDKNAKVSGEFTLRIYQVKKQ